MNDKNNIGKIEKPSGLIRNVSQLSDKKKKANGFKNEDSVIDVEQKGYAVTYGEDILFTYGIEPCCGVVVFNDEKRVLFHLDDSINVDDVKRIIAELEMKDNANVVVAPGVTCGVIGKFDYRKLEEELKCIGYNVQEHRIPLTFGFITVNKDQIIIGSALDKEQSYSINIDYQKRLTNESQRIVREALEDTDISKLEEIKEIIERTKNKPSEREK